MNETEFDLFKALQFYTEAYSRLLSQIQEEELIATIFCGGDMNAFDFLKEESVKLAKEANEVIKAHRQER